MAQPWKQLGRYGTVGLELVVAMAVCYWLGRWADGKLGTKYLALLGLLVGVIAGFRNLMRAASAMQREADREAEAEARAHRPHHRPLVVDEEQDGRDVRPNARGSHDGDAPS